MDELSNIEKNVLALNKKGKSQQEIADELGYPTRSSVRTILDRLRSRGIQIESQRHNGKRVAAVNAMIKEGKTHGEIAATLGLSSKTLTAWKYSNKIRQSRERTKPVVEKVVRLPKWQSAHEQQVNDLKSLGTRKIDWSKYPKFEDIPLKKRYVRY